jgi:hypothetical protein
MPVHLPAWNNSGHTGWVLWNFILKSVFKMSQSNTVLITKWQTFGMKLISPNSSWSKPSFGNKF